MGVTAGEQKFDSHTEVAPCVAVVGMHRSGTSATAGLLIGLGLAGPRPEDLVPADESNQRGHWESQAVHLCNSHLLAALGATTYAPPPITSNWDHVPGFDEIRAEARMWFTATSAGRPMVLKDPRLCITLPLWRSAIPAPMGAIFLLRDPMEVARSLQARDGVPVMLGLALWDRYVRSATLGLEGMPTLVVDYDGLLADPVKSSESMCAFLEQLGIDLDPGMTSLASQYLDPHLRHQQTEGGGYDRIAQDQRDILAILAERSGAHLAWHPPPLPPAPAWVEDVLELRREMAMARRELHWIKASRAYRLASALWRLTGRAPAALTDPTQETHKGMSR